VLAGLVFAAALLALLAAVFSAGSADVITATGEPAVTAADLDELISRSEVVVIARVVDRRPGRVVGEDLDAEETHEQLRYDEIVLEVVEVLAGSGLAAGDQVVYEEIAGFVDDDRLLVFEGAARRARIGDSGIYFLVQERGQPALALTTPDSRILVSGSRLLQEPRITPAIEELERSTPVDAMAAIRSRSALVGTDIPTGVVED
jgi:hypothetical protein